MTVWSIEVEVDKNKIYPQNKTKLLKHLILLFVAIVRVVAASSKISQSLRHMLLVTYLWAECSRAELGVIFPNRDYFSLIIIL